MSKKTMDQKWAGQKPGSKVGPSAEVPSDQVMELVRLQHSGPAKTRSKTRS